MAQLGDDCFYFYNAGCHRGPFCVYRHQPSAKATVETCADWLKGSCTNKACSLRHAIIGGRVIPRATVNNNIPCKYEASGCLNDHCPFFHVNKVSSAPVLASYQSALVKPNVVHQTATLPTNPIVVNGFTPSGFSNSLVGVVPRPVVSVQHFLPATLAPVLTGVISGPPETIPLPQQTLAVIGAPSVNSFPKHELFSEQVQLFKKMLASKEKKTIEKSPISDDDEPLSDKHRYTERQKSKRNKKYKESHANSKLIHKRTKDTWIKENGDILYPTSKDVRNEKKHKKRNSRNKSELEVLRERALWKLHRRRQEDKFNEEFEKLLNEKEQHRNDAKANKRCKSTSDDGDDTDNAKIENSVQLKRKKVEKNLTSLDDESFSKDDALELGLDVSPIREYLDEPESSSENDKCKDIEQVDLCGNSCKTNSLESGAVLVIPDETTSINFSVDEDDELLQELHEADKTNTKTNIKLPTVPFKITKSQKNHNGSKSGNNSNSSIDNKKEHLLLNSTSKITKNQQLKFKSSISDTSSLKSKGINSVVSVPSKPKELSPVQDKISQIEEISSSSKRKVIRIESNPKDDHVFDVALKSHVQNKIKLSDNNENSRIKLCTEKESVQSSSKLDQVKIKSFEEIMEEKRKRNALHTEVLVISDEGESATVLTPEKTVKQQIVRRPNSEEERPKRKCLKIYKPPVSNSADNRVEILVPQVPKLPATKSSIIPTKKTLVLKKPTSSSEVVGNVSNRPVTIKSTFLASKNEGGVMSFDQIMEAKRLRKQKEKREKQFTVQAKQDLTNSSKKTAATTESHKKSYLKRKPVIKRSTSISSVQPTVSTEKVNTTSINVSSMTTVAKQTPVKTAFPANITQGNHTRESLAEQKTSGVARVSLLHNNSSEVLNRSESLTEEQLLGDVTPTSPHLPVITSPRKKGDYSDSFVEDLAKTPLKTTVPLPNFRKLSTSKHLAETEQETKLSTINLRNAIENKKSLDEQKRKQKANLLSDDEFEKEINDLCSEDVDEVDEDFDEDDLMMELQEMLDS